MDSAYLSDIEKYCANISGNIRTTFPYLELHFLIHQRGERSDQITKLLPLLKGHPAFDKAASILKFRTAGKEGTSFLGIAEGFEEASFFSLKRDKKSLAFIAIELSQYTSVEDAHLDIYACIAHMFEVLSFIESSQYKTETGFLLPKKSQIATSRSNLRADIYSILQLSREGIYDAPQKLAKRRSIETLTPQSSIRPEDYPFPLCLDVTQYAIENHIVSSSIINGTSQMVSLYQLANQISSCFESDNLYTWTQFANNSQTMAWSGFTASQILGAAVNTSTNPFIKSLGHMMAELTNLSPVDEEHLPHGYNPFLADEISQIRHERLVEETFEMIMIHTVEAESHLPLIRVANNQNEGLLKGKISGWCASALHAAAKAYAGAKERGIPPVQAARLEFQSAQNQSNWKSLLQIAQQSITTWRKGDAVTMGELIKWCKQMPDAKFILDSLSLTIADPSYKIRLDAASAIPSLTAKFAGPSSMTSRPSPQVISPSPSFIPELTLGGGGGGGGTLTASPPSSIIDDDRGS